MNTGTKENEEQQETEQFSMKGNFQIHSIKPNVNIYNNQSASLNHQF